MTGDRGPAFEVWRRAPGGAAAVTVRRHGLILNAAALDLLHRPRPRFVVLLHDLNARLLGVRVATRYDEPDVYSVSRTGVVACRRFVELLGITDERCPARLADGVLIVTLLASNGPDAG